MRIRACFAAASVCLLFASLGFAQSVSDLRRSDSGNTEWNPAKRTLAFASTGIINFNKPDYKGTFWEVPKEVVRIVIGCNVRVIGAFHTRADCSIAGRDRKTFGRLRNSGSNGLVSCLVLI
jgi:hypothetical protein